LFAHGHKWWLHLPRSDVGPLRTSDVGGHGSVLATARRPTACACRAWQEPVLMIRTVAPSTSIPQAPRSAKPAVPTPKPTASRTVWIPVPRITGTCSNTRQRSVVVTPTCNVGGGSTLANPQRWTSWRIGYYQLKQTVDSGRCNGQLDPTQELPALQRHQRAAPSTCAPANEILLGPAPPSLPSRLSASCARGSIAVVCHAPGAPAANKKFGRRDNRASVVGPTGASEPAATASLNAALAGVTLQLIGAYRSHSYALTQAADGKEYVVVTFRQLPGNATALADSAMASTLKAGSITYHPVSLNLPSVKDSESHGSLVFEILTGANPLVLSLGSKPAIPLDIPAP